jgi:trimethylamine--corrinoid protein Co-methyltransferase
VVNYKVSGGLSQEQLEQLNEKALEILETMGMEIESEKTLTFLEGKPGFIIDKHRVRMERKLLESCIEHSRSSNKQWRPKKDEWNVEILSGYPTHYVDWHDNQMKPVLQSNLVEMSKLVDVLYDRGVRGSAPGVPQDLDCSIRGVRGYKMGAQLCRCGGSVPATTLEDVDWIYRMTELTGRGFGLGVYVINPLKADGTTFDQLLQLKGKKFGVGVGCMPMMGISAPINILGAFVIAVASVLGSYAIVKELTDAEHINVECRVWPVNMRNLDIVYGLPQMVLSDFISTQVRQFYGWEEGNGCDSFHSSAIMPDQQASAQRAAYAMAQALNGRRTFRFGGLLGVDMVFSPQQLLLDLEILRYTKYVADGFEFSEKAFSMDVIKNVGPSGSFLLEEETLEDYKKVSWDSDLWLAESLSSWQNNSPKSIMEKAGDEIDELIKNHDYHLPEDLNRDLEKLCSEAEKHILSL